MGSEHHSIERPGGRTLRAVLEPKRVAVVGASASPEKRGHQILKALLGGDFAGEVIAVNPKGGNILGVDVVTSLSEVHGSVDLAVLALPSSAAVEALGAAAEAGVGAAIVLAVGFGESGEEGAEREARLRQIAADSPIRIVGPNTSGVFNAHAGLNVIGTPNVAAGAVSILTQSGNVALALMRGFTANGVGVSTCLGVGNQIDVGFGEALEFLSRHAPTKSVVVYAEELTGGADTTGALARAAARLPVIVLKGGRTKEGAQVAASHTGALAAPYDVLASALEQVGATLTTREDELVPLGAALATQPADPRGVAILSDGGGQATHLTDVLAKKGADLARLSADTQRALRSLLGPAAAVRNPVDLAGSADADPTVFGEALRILMADDAVGAVLVAGLFGGYHLRFAPSLLEAEMAAAETFVELASQAAKPLVVHTMYANESSPVLSRLGDAQVPVLESIDVAASVVDALQRRGRFLVNGLHPCGAGPSAAPGRGMRGSAVKSVGAEGTGAGPQERMTVGEWAARQELASHSNGAGVPLVEARLCRSSAEVEESARDLAAQGSTSNETSADRFVLKAHGASLGHKTESGGVLLDVPATELAVRAEELLLGVPGAEGVIVQPMMRSPLAELLIAVRRDPTVGVAATVGAGGIWTEVLEDVAHVLVPFRTGGVVSALETLRVGARLRGARGRARAHPSTLESIESLVGRISEWITGRPDVVEVELNPLFVYAERVVAVDALLVRSSPSESRAGVA